MFGHQPRTAHLKPSCHLLPSVPVSLISVCRINCTQAKNLEIILDQNLSPAILAPLAHPTSLSLASHTFRCLIPFGPTLPWVCGGIAQREGTEQCRSLLETPQQFGLASTPCPPAPTLLSANTQLCAVCAPPSPYLGSYSKPLLACPAVIHQLQKWSSGRASVGKLACCPGSVPGKNHFPHVTSYLPLWPQQNCGSHLSPLLGWVLLKVCSLSCQPTLLGPEQGCTEETPVTVCELYK